MTKARTLANFIGSDSDVKFDTDTLYVDSSEDRVGVGTTSPSGTLTVKDAPAKIHLTNDTNTGTAEVTFRTTTGSNRGFMAYDFDNDDMSFRTGGSGTAMTIDSAKRVLIGGQSDSIAAGGIQALLQVEGTGGDASLSLVRHSASVNTSYFTFGKSRGADATIVQDGDSIGFINFAGADGTDINSYTAYIGSQVDGTPGSNDMPGRLTFYTTSDGASIPTERMRISNNGNVTIGYTTDLGRKLSVNGDAYITGGYLEFGGSESTPTTANPTIYRNNPGAGPNMVFANNATEAMRVDQGQRLLIGTNAHRSSFFNNNVGTYRPIFQVEAANTSSGTRMMSFVLNDDSNNAFIQIFGRSRGTTANSLTAVAEDDNIGVISWQGATGNALAEAAQIKAEVDGTPGSNDMPGRLVFRTTGDGNSSSSERMRISEDGTVSIGYGGSHPSILRLRQEIDTSANTATGVLTLQGGASTYSSFLGMDATGLSIGLSSSSRNLRFVTNSSTAMTIDTSQRVLIGLSSDIGTGHKLQVNNDATIMTFDGTTTGANGVRFIKSRASSPGSNAIVADGDDVGFLDFRADDGTDYQTRTAVITSSVDGTPGTNDMPGNLRFFTTADGSSSVTERMRIDSTGRTFVGSLGYIGTATTNSVFEAHGGSVVFGSSNESNNQGYRTFVRFFQVNNSSGLPTSANLQLLGMTSEFYCKITVVGVNPYAGSNAFTYINESTGYAGGNFSVISANEYGNGTGISFGTATLVNPSGTDYRINIPVTSTSGAYRFVATAEIIGISKQDNPRFTYS